MDTKISREDLDTALEQLGMSADDPELYCALVEGNMHAAALVDTVGQDSGPAIPERDWQRPADADNPLGAWYVKTHIEGPAGGKLSGRTVAVKDTVLLAGVPAMCGTPILEGYTPAEDAEIVTRMLDAGATITGKSVCEAYCFSGGSHTSATGPVRNPHNPAHTSGGSSSGSGALVAAGEVDMAIGCDQGGSVRIPASNCGIVGLKPTYGLIPYTGILGMNPNIDHTGPMTRTVADNALLLEVLAGADGVDSRQVSPRVEAYTDALDGGIAGLKVGMVGEGFATEASDPAVDASVRAAAESLAGLGAEVSELSIPLHSQAAGVTFAGIQSLLTSMFQLNGCLLERPDLVPERYQELHAHWRERADELPHNIKIGLLTAQITHNRYGYRYITRGMQKLPLVRAAYDRALEQVDVLVMPTTVTTAAPLPPADAPADVALGAAFGPLANTAAFNSTHHPALSIPCGMLEGLPVGMMLIGRHWEESTLYRVGQAFEQQQDWRER
jgi:amidase